MMNEALVEVVHEVAVGRTGTQDELSEEGVKAVSRRDRVLSSFFRLLYAFSW